MFSLDHKLATITVVLPAEQTQEVARELTADRGTQALEWQARGTLLHEHWLKRWFPPISPAKRMLQMTVPHSEVDHIVNTAISVGKLNYQATGAVFATPHDHAYLGSGFQTWPGEETQPRFDDTLKSTLTAIYCIVGHNVSDRICKAAVNSGAHGPIIYYCEGRGLRDRLGWLRITKEHEKEVLMVLCDEADSEEVFDAMAKAGGLHLPGRGFMYRLKIDKGMFNLPSRVAHHHYDASMQQVINAIDHLQGHTHWRDQTVFDIGEQGRGTGLESLLEQKHTPSPQTCLSAIVPSSQMHLLINLLLDTGVPGLNFSYAKLRDHSLKNRVAGEYALIRSITDQSTAEQICGVIDTHAEDAGLKNLAVTLNTVSRVATYVPGRVDYRAA